VCVWGGTFGEGCPPNGMEFFNPHVLITLTCCGSLSDPVVVLSRARRAALATDNIVDAAIDRDYSGASHHVLPAGGLGGDIAAAHHDGYCVTLTLRATPTCKDPILKGRLSGPSLSMLVWSKPEPENLKHAIDLRKTLKGCWPNLAVGGRYFLEIIALSCKPLPTSGDVSTYCLRDQNDANVLGVHVIARVDPTQEKGGPARWETRPPGHYLAQTSPNKDDEQPTPLFTRYQPQGCRGQLFLFRGQQGRASEFCKVATTTERFAPGGHPLYRWEWASDAPFDVVPHNGGDVCFVGDSHNRYLARLLVSSSDQGGRWAPSLPGRVQYWCLRCLHP
jgi:hypothetical protein